MLALAAAVVLLLALALFDFRKPQAGDRLLARSTTNLYGDGLSFSSLGGREFQSVGCTREGVRPATLCPVTLHLPDGEVTPADLADPRKLKARGWTETATPRRDLVQYVWLDGSQADERALAVAVFSRGALHTFAFRSRVGHEVSVHDRRFRLPIAAPALEFAMGRPGEHRRYDVAQGVREK
jgi:hypothetical protein